MKTSSAKAKGRRLCQWVKDELLHRFAGTLQTDDIVVTSSGDTGEDLKLSPLARQCAPYQIECKNRARIGIYTDYEQALGHGDREALLVVKSNRHQPLVIVSASHFFDLLKQLQQKE